MAVYGSKNVAFSLLLFLLIKRATCTKSRNLDTEEIKRRRLRMGASNAGDAIKRCVRVAYFRACEASDISPKLQDCPYYAVPLKFHRPESGGSEEERLILSVVCSSCLHFCARWQNFDKCCVCVCVCVCLFTSLCVRVRMSFYENIFLTVSITRLCPPWTLTDARQRKTSKQHILCLL